jgi:eukaryotic-like serine/threonine-protein kinase
MSQNPLTDRSIFLAAIDIASPAEREAYVARACEENPELRAEVQALLAAHGQSGDLLDAPDRAAMTIDQSAERPGTQIGPYKLLQQIGEGGMGVVYMAEQTEPVQRKVALKLIKPGMDSRQIIARFEAERQALAMMDHANIARVLDAGTTGEPEALASGLRHPPAYAGGSPGRPYFVMELVHGVPITKYCDDNRLTPRQRLELFVPVCQAIQHAHQKGIIHRDIKPSNVMVTLYDGQPVPKVIDFGVAKATEQKLTERTLFTQYGTMVGTLEYMSPEQAEMSALGVDTRSDIYSLGVLLYELLTGSTPLDQKRVREAAYAEILRIIKEEEPPKPSTRLSESGDALASISAQRHTEPAKLSKLMRGELDWIVMKTLEKDRNRRYETANGFAADVQRYLNDEPVQACPPSSAYRFRKFARRNKGPMLAATLVALALFGGVFGTTWGMFRAKFAEAQAVREAGEKSVALSEKEAALTSAKANEIRAKANEIQAKAAQNDAQENLKDALAAVDQMLTRVAEDRLAYVPQMEPIRRDLLLDALKFYQKFLDKQSDDPVIRREAALAHRRVGRIHHHLGQYKDAERAYRNALEMFDKLDPSAFADPALLREMVNCHIEFSWPLYELRKVEESRQTIRRAVEVADKLDPKAPGNLHYILNARNNLASILLSEEPHEAEKILKESLVLAASAYELQGVHRRLARVFVATGRLHQAEEAFRQGLIHAEQLAKENPSADWVQAHLAHAQRELASVIASQRPGDAEEIQRRAVLILDKLATDFPNGPGYRKALAVALIENAELLKKLGRATDAEKAYRRAIEVYEKLALDFPTMPAFWQTSFDQRLKLGLFLEGAGKTEEASRLYQDAGATVSKLAIDSPTRLEHWVELSRAHSALSRMLRYAGKKQESEAPLREIVALSEKLEAEFADKPERRRDVAHCHMSAAWELAEAGHHADADRLYSWALRHYDALVREAPQAKQSQEDLARFYRTVGGFHLWRTRRLKDADRSFQAALEIFEKLALQFHEMPVYRVRAAECRFHLGIVAERDGRIQKAEQDFRQGIRLAEEVAKELPNDGDLRMQLSFSYRWLAQFLGGAGSPEEVEKLLVRSFAVLDELVAEFPNADGYLAELSNTCRALAEHHFRTGRTDEGRRLYQRVIGLGEQILASNTGWANNVGWLNYSAQFLVRRADGSPRAARLAVELAQKAAALQPDQAGPFRTLGMVLSQQKKLDDAIAAYRKAIALDGNYHPAHNDLAWLLSTCADAKHRDPAQAVVLAKKAVELDQKNQAYANTLGAAYYRTSDWNAAIASLEKSMELSKGGDSFDWFFLAMAHWQLGEKDKAREWYDRAAEWMDKNQPTNEELLRFRAEAAELLAVENNKD